MDRATALSHIEELLERAVKRFSLEQSPAERDVLLSSAMTAYQAFGYISWEDDVPTSLCCCQVLNTAYENLYKILELAFVS